MNPTFHPHAPKSTFPRFLLKLLLGFFKALFIIFLTVLFLLGAGLFFLRLTFDSSAAPKVIPELAPRRIDGHLHFILGKTRFVIPESYGPGAAHNYLGIPDSASFQAVLPNLEGETPQNQHEFQVLGWGNILYVTLDMNLRPDPKISSTERFANATPYIPERKYLRKEYGLEVYPDATILTTLNNRMLINTSAFYHVYFNEANRPTVLFHCIIDVPSPACKGEYDFNHEIIVSFTFHSKYLPQWKTIWQKLDALLKNHPKTTLKGK